MSSTSEKCLLCDQTMGFFKNELNDCTGISERPLSLLFDVFIGIKLTKDVIDSGGICQDCFIKFNVMDEQMLIINRTQSKLVELFKQKKPVKKSKNSASKEKCAACGESSGVDRTELGASMSISGRPLYLFYELCLGVSLSHDQIDSSSVCKDCFTKLNEIDERQETFKQMKDDFHEMFRRTQPNALVRKIIEQPMEKIIDIIVKPDFDMVMIKQEDHQIDATDYEKDEEVEKVPLKDEIDDSTTDGDFNDDVGAFNSDFSETEEIKEKSPMLKEPTPKEKPPPKKKEKDSHTKKKSKEPSRKEKQKVPLAITTKEEVEKIMNELKEKLKEQPITLELPKVEIIPTTIGGVKRYQCDICQQVCLGPNKLILHREKHKTTRDIACDQCDAMFKTRKSLVSHKSRMHKNRPVCVCDICGAICLKREYMIKHMNSIHLKKRNHICTDCGKWFVSSSTLKIHMNIHKKNNNLFCKICDFATCTIDRLNRHMMSHTDERKFSCDICGAKFRQSSNVKDHKNNIHGQGERKHSCAVCGVSFLKKCHLTKHTESIHVRGSKQRVKKEEQTKAKEDFASDTVRIEEEKRFQCDQCPLITKTMHQLKVHKETHKEVKDIICDQCGALFKTRKTLMAHRKIHFKRPSLYCDICGANYKDKSVMRKHMITSHLKIKEHVCTICGKNFFHSSALSTHMVCHTGAKNFACTFCDFRTRSNYLLNDHMATHTRERKFVCEHCDKSFIHRNSLKQHQERNHFDPMRRFPCTLCHRKFYSEADAERHVTVGHNKTNEVCCEFCGKKFKREANKLKHMEKTHARYF